MNNNKSTKWITGAMMSALIASGFTACTDDHFDINPDVLGQQTLWENIKNNPNTSDFADILQNVYYSQTEVKTTPETYADVLNGEQTFTVWAPVNGSFDYQYYKGLINSGVRDSIWKVEKELIRNNMARYRYVINSHDSVKIQLFNEKAAWLNYDNKTLKNSHMQETNVGSKNGILHFTNSPVSYQPNLYEFMATRPNLSDFNSFIKYYQEVKFSEGASTQGPTINGQITYVDSVTYITNRYTRDYMGALITEEDSNYVMIMPTNEAWQKMIEKTQKFYRYKNSYKQDVYTQTEAGKDTTITGAETNFSQAELDSIINLRSKNAIAQNLAFNANWQEKQIPITSLKDIQALDARKDSLISTSGDKFKKAGTLNETNKEYCHEVESFAEMFGNAEPVETSNGYAYIVNDYKLPTTVYAPTIDRSAAVFFEFADNNCRSNTTSKTYDAKALATLSEESGIEPYDSTYKYNYFVMGATSSTAHPGANFRLLNVLSCKYDIYVVIGHNTDYNLPNKFRAFISYDNESKRQNNVALKNMNEDAVDANGKTLYNTNYFVTTPAWMDESGIAHYNDTVCIAHDFEFPICYEGVKNAYPVLNIKSNFSSTEKNFYSREIWVHSIILKAKEW